MSGVEISSSADPKSKRQETSPATTLTRKGAGGQRLGSWETSKEQSSKNEKSPAAGARPARVLPGCPAKKQQSTILQSQQTNTETGKNLPRNPTTAAIRRQLMPKYETADKWKFAPRGVHKLEKKNYEWARLKKG